MNPPGLPSRTALATTTSRERNPAGLAAGASACRGSAPVS